MTVTYTAPTSPDLFVSPERDNLVYETGSVVTSPRGESPRDRFVAAAATREDAARIVAAGDAHQQLTEIHAIANPIGDDTTLEAVQRCLRVSQGWEQSARRDFNAKDAAEAEVLRLRGIVQSLGQQTDEHLNAVSALVVRIDVLTAENERLATTCADLSGRAVDTFDLPDVGPVTVPEGGYGLAVDGQHYDERPANARRREAARMLAIAAYIDAKTPTGPDISRVEEYARVLQAADGSEDSWDECGSQEPYRRQARALLAHQAEREQ